MADYTITAGDLSPGLEYELTDDGTGQAPAVGDIQSAKFQMTTSAYKEIIDASATVTTASSGNPLLQYAWQAGDTGNAGSYLGRFEVTYRDSGSGSDTVTQQDSWLPSFSETDAVLVELDNARRKLGIYLEGPDEIDTDHSDYGDDPAF